MNLSTYHYEIYHADLFSVFFSISIAIAQNGLYASLSDLYADKYEEVTQLAVDRRSKIQAASIMGADYKVSVPSDKKRNKYLKKKCYAVKQDDSFYVNCKRLKYKRFRFGYGYAPAYWIDGCIYFKAIPVGSVTAHATTSMNVKLGGTVGDAFAASGLISQRVFYMINPETGKAEFVGKQRIWHLLEGNRSLQDKLLEEDNESAETLEPYLLAVKSR